MNLEGTHYDAFISYRHCELDMFVAKALHKKLENFRLPKSVRKEHPQLPVRINRVFRDQEELPLVNNLADPITEALKNSDNLIVICTPRLPESKWCRKEIETFIQLHGREHVFVVLAEGTPEESFPAELCVDDEGNPREPLAADFTGKSYYEVLKKMKLEVLRLIAPMFGLNFDDLRQRHREQRIKRIMTAGAVAGAVIIGFGAYCGITALKIKKQAEEISAQNEQITKQNEQIATQYKEAQAKYAISTASNVEELMSRGRRKDAVYAIRNAMPSSMESEDYPYTPEAQCALTDAVSAYATGGVLIPTHNYDCPNGIRYFSLSIDGKYILFLDDADIATIYDTESDKPVASVETTGNGYETSKIAFINNTEFIAHDDEGAFVYNVIDQTKEYVGVVAMKIFLSDNKEMALLIDNDKASVIKAADHSVVGSFENLDFKSITDVSFDNSCERVYISGVDREDIRKVWAFNTSDMSLIFDIRTAEYSRGLSYDMCFGNDTLFVFYDDTDSYTETRSRLAAYDSSTGERKYVIDEGKRYILEMNYFTLEGNNYLYAYGFNGPYTFDADTGELLNYYEDGVSVIESVGLVGDEKDKVLYREDGSMMIYNTVTGMANSYKPYAYDFIGSVAEANLFSSHMYVYCNGQNYVTKYEYICGENVTQIGSMITLNCGYTSDGKYSGVLDVYDTNRFMLWDVEKGEEKWEYDVSDKGVQTAFFSQDNSKVVLTGKSIIILDIQTGNVIEERTFDLDIAPKFTKVSGDKSVVSGYRGKSAAVILLDDKDGEITEYNCDVSVTKYAVSSSTLKLYRMNESQNEIDVYNPGGEEPSLKKKLEEGLGAGVVISDDNRHVFIRYINGTVEICNSETMETEKILYDAVSYFDEVIYIRKIDGYLIPADAGCLLDNGLNRIASLDKCRAYDPETNELMCEVGGKVVKTPIYQYDEIISFADEFLGDYEPTEIVRNRYSIH